MGGRERGPAHLLRRPLLPQVLQLREHEGQEEEGQAGRVDDDVFDGLDVLDDLDVLDECRSLVTTVICCHIY